MAKILINDLNKALVDNGNAYAVINMDATEGQSPLTVTAAAGKVLRLLRTGMCTQVSIPSPSSPVDIYCNNGKIALRYESGLPIGYQLLEWLSSDKNVETARPTTNNTEIRAKWYRRANSAQYLYWSDSGSSLTTNTTAYLSRTGNWRFGNKVIAVDAAPSTEYISIQNKNGVWVNGEKVGNYVGVDTFTSTKNLRILGPNTASDITRIYWLEHYESGVLVAKYLPVKRLSDNAYGFYDVLGDAFYTNAEATFTAGNNVTEAIIVVTDGTAETITLGQQTASVADLLQAGDIRDEQDIVTGVVTRRLGIIVLKGTEDWVEGTNAYTLDNAISKVAYPSLSLCTHFNVVSSDVAANFLPANGMKIGASGYRSRIYIKVSAFASAADLQDFLAAQYAAGTPVIIVYPLETPTTEQVTPQPLNTASGSNTIQSNVNGAEIKIVYHISTS